MHQAKRIFSTLLVFLILSSCLKAQLYDRQWVYGDPMSIMVFDSLLPPTFIPIDSQIPTFFTIGNICDARGNMQFYTNGISVYNRLGKKMKHGDSLSYPTMHYDVLIANGMAAQEGVVILPMPNDTNQYYIFHYSPADSQLASTGGVALRLYYSIVDMRLDSGRGDVTAKNVVILDNELQIGRAHV